MSEKIEHNCGLVGVTDLAGKQNVVLVAQKMAEMLQHRGQRGAGIAWLNDNGQGQRLSIHKGAGDVKDVLHLPTLNQLGAYSTAAIAHTRYATNAHLERCMMHPYHYPNKDPSAEFALAFNGNIPDYSEQQKYLEKRGIHPTLPGDTEIIGQMIVAGLQDHTHGNMKKVFQSIGGLDGAYNLVLLHGDGNIHAIRDRLGHHPLAYARNGTLAAVASEDVAIREVWPHANIQHLQPGESLRFCRESIDVSVKQIWASERHLCFFELVYFGDHRSHIDGISVSNVRYECGKILAEQDMQLGFDGMSESNIVVQVPESAKTAANGYSNARRLRRIDAILKNPKPTVKVGRTFIADQDRGKMSDEKYEIKAKFVQGESIILMDDSLVRGTTMKRVEDGEIKGLVRRLRDAGAVAIHLRLASPPILAPCFYGIDFPTVRELLARRFVDGTLKEGDLLPDDVLHAIATHLDLDSIRYLPVSAIPRALGRLKEEICMACVTGDYPTPNGKRLYEIANANNNQFIAANSTMSQSAIAQ